MSFPHVVDTVCVGVCMKYFWRECIGASQKVGCTVMIQTQNFHFQDRLLLLPYYPVSLGRDGLLDSIIVYNNPNLSFSPASNDASFDQVTDFGCMVGKMYVLPLHFGLCHVTYFGRHEMSRVLYACAHRPLMPMLLP